TRSQDDVGAGSRPLLGTDDAESGASVHLPAEQPVDGALEDGPPVPERDVTTHMAVAGRQRLITRGADLWVGQLGTLPAHQTTVVRGGAASELDYAFLVRSRQLG